MQIITIALYIQCMATGLVAKSIIENVDLSELTTINTRITYTFNDNSYIDTLDKEILEKQCSGIQDAVLCDALLRKSMRSVIFNIKTIPQLIADKLSLSEDKAELVMYLKYRPYQFRLSSGIYAEEREIQLIYPDYKAVVFNIRDYPVMTRFILEYSNITRLNITLPSYNYTIGDIIKIPSLLGKLCVASITREDIQYISQLSLGCGGFHISTSMIDRSGSYNIKILVVGETISAGSVQVELNSPELDFRIKTDKKRVNTGEIFNIIVEPQDILESCKIRIINPVGNIVFDSDYSRCDRIPVAVSPTWTGGNYVIVMDATDGALWGKSSTVIWIGGPRYANAVIKTDKTIYNAGETVNIYIGTKGDYCITGLYSNDYRKLALAQSDSCGDVKIHLDPSLKPDTYIIRTKVYRFGMLEAIGTADIQVEEWKPPKISEYSLLCGDGFFYIGDYVLPCLSYHNQVCRPLSVGLPLCLCFDRTDILRDICNSGESCGEDGCREENLSPYIIAIDNGICRARRGLEEVSCVFVSEICDDSCVCLDDEYNPLDFCSSGELCTSNGCSKPELYFHVTSISTRHVRSELLEKGAGIVWMGDIFFKAMPLDSDFISYLRANASLGGKHAYKTEIKFDSTTGKYRVLTYFRASLLPGRYPLILTLLFQHGDKTISTSVRREFYVYYPKSYSLDVDILDIDIDAINLNQLREGIAFRVDALVLDNAGNRFTGFGQRDIYVTVDGKKARVTSVNYNSLAGLWRIGVLFITNKTLKTGRIKLRIDSLGRLGEDTQELPLVFRDINRIKILRVMPGNLDEPVFYSATVVGFDLDIYLEVRIDFSVSEEDFNVKIGGYDFSHKIKYLTSTSDGVKLHLSDISFCPPDAELPSPDSALPVEVSVEKGEIRLEDRGTMIIKPNPGDWINGEIGCK